MVDEAMIDIPRLGQVRLDLSSLPFVTCAVSHSRLPLSYKHIGVLLGAGASVLGNVHVGDGCQVGAGTLVISDLPPHSVAVGVPAKIIGSFVDVTGQPSIAMNQMTGTRDFDEHIITFESGGI